MENKQTIAELAVYYQISESTVKRRLAEISIQWQQYELQGSGYVHLDVTYWGRGWGVLLALDSQTGLPLYVSYVTNETNQDYIDAVISISERN